MMRVRIAAFGVAAVAAIVMVMVNVSNREAIASTGQATFSGTWYTCEVSPPENLEATDTYVKFDSTRFGLWVTDDNRLNGDANTSEKLYFNFEKGQGTSRVRGDLEPSGADGVWKIRAALRLTQSGGSGYGIAVGKGALRGTVALFRMDAAVVSPEDNPCSDSTDAVAVSGRILSRR